MSILDLFRKKSDCYSILKKKSDKFNKNIEKYSDLLEGFFYFKRLTGEEWQVFDALKSQLAHGIVSQKLDAESAHDSCYVFDLLRITWLNDDGSLVITDDERFEGLTNGEIDPFIVNEVCKLALEANDFILTKEALEEKKKYLNLKKRNTDT